MIRRRRINIDLGSFELLNGKYEVVRELGTGGTSKVFLVKHKKLGVNRAIKMIEKNEINSECYHVEINVLNKVNISGVPIIYDVEEDEFNWYIVEEYIEGMSMLSYLENDNNCINKVIEYFYDICTILEALHNIKPFGVIYRDLKPNNIIISQRGVFLIDYGNCLLMDGQARKFIMASVEYAAPEQLTNEEPGVWTDVYSIGVLLQKVYKNYQQSMYEYKEEILKIITICMEKDPMKRYSSPLIVKNNLQNAINRKCDTANCNNIDIYVCGCRRFAGVTHFALGFSKYLSEKSCESVYLEENTTKQIIKMVRYDDQAEYDNGTYVYEKCRILPDYGGFCKEESREYQVGRCVNIHDIGLYDEKVKDIKGIVIVVITDVKTYQEFLFNNIINENEDRKMLYVANFSEEKAIRKILRQKNVDIVKMPYFENPFKMNKSLNEFYESIMKRINGEKFYEKHFFRKSSK